MNERETRERILTLVSEYAKEFHQHNDEFIEGSRIPYASRVYDEKEMVNLVDSALDFWLTSGRYTEEFEKKFAEYLGVKYVSLCNSGSSANLLAFSALTSPLLKERQIKRGDEIITVAAGFPTTVTPIIQYGCIPVFVDVTIPGYNIDASLLDRALSQKTKAVMMAHTLGNPFNLEIIKSYCDKNQLWLIEDNCDSLGSTYKIDGEVRLTGTIGDIGTSSFYPPHHMTMGEGGAVYTNNPLLHKIIRSMRDWGRDCSCSSGQDNLCGHRFDKQYGELPIGYDHKYVYSHFGYNLKATDMQAAIGCAQLDKIKDFVVARQRNFDFLLSEMVKLGAEEHFVLPRAEENSNPSWFGFIMTCKNARMRNSIVQYVESKGIQTRMLFSGNLTKHPCFTQAMIEGTDYRIVGELTNTDRIMNDSFWVGVYPGMTEAKLSYIAKMIMEAVKN